MKILFKKRKSLVAILESEQDKLIAELMTRKQLAQKSFQTFEGVSGFRDAFEVCLDKLFVQKAHQLSVGVDSKALGRNHAAESPNRHDTSSKHDDRSYLSQRVGLAAVQKSSLDKAKTPKRELRSIYSPHSRVPEEEKSSRDMQKSKRVRPYSNSELNRTTGSFQKKYKTSILSISRTSKRDKSPQTKPCEQESEKAPNRPTSNKRSFKLLSAKESLSKDLVFKLLNQDFNRTEDVANPKPSSTRPEKVLCPSPKVNLSVSQAKKASAEADLKKRVAINSCKSLDAREYLFTKQDLQSENDPQTTGWSRMKRKSHNEVDVASAKKPQTSNKKSGSPSNGHSRLQSNEEQTSKKKPAKHLSFLDSNIEIKINNKKDFTPLFF